MCLLSACWALQRLQIYKNFVIRKTKIRVEVLFEQEFK